MIACVVVLAACTTNGGTEVPVLWLGTQPDGSLASGVLPVSVAVTQAGSGPLAVDLSGLERTGEAWHAAAWSAAAVGVLLTARLPEGVTVSMGVDESIDGPSGGAAMAVGVLAQLESVTLLPGTTVTGTVQPSGAIGPVGGIPEKVRAAAAHGISTVLIPAGQRVAGDPRTSSDVDTVALGLSLGVDVVEVSSLATALSLMSGGAVDWSTSAPLGMSASVTAFLSAETDRTLARLRQVALHPSPTLALDSERRRVQSGIDSASARVPVLTAAGDVATAYARATLAEREAAAWNAEAQAVAAARLDLEPAREKVVAQCGAVAESAAAALMAAASTETPRVEQAVALPDALTWAVDAEASATRARQDAAGSSSPLEIGMAAADAARAGYAVTRYLPTALGVLARTGNRATPPGIDTQLDGYTALLVQSGEAVTAALALAGPASGDEPALAGYLYGGWSLGSAPPLTGAAARSLAAAMAWYVSTATIAAEAEATSALPARLGTRRSITRPDLFATQVAVADEQLVHLGSGIVADGLDPSYLAWGGAWGRAAATAPDSTSAPDDLRIEGLQYQWYATIQAAALRAITRSQ